MIRINLLPARKTKQRETVQQQLLAFAAVLCITIVGCVGWWKWKDNEVQERNKIISAKNEELKQLEKIIGEVNEFTTTKKELEEKLAVIQDLKKGKTGPVRAMDDLASEIPKRVWLEKVEEKGGAVTFEGKAIDNEDVSAFMKALEKSKYFQNIQLSFSKEHTFTTAGPGGESATIYEFKITCGVNYAS